jgi:hypothetical protein
LRKRRARTRGRPSSSCTTNYAILGEGEDSHGQLYVREGGETKAEWEASGRKGLLPGVPPQGEHPPQIVIDSLLPDRALEALFEIDFSELEDSSFKWDWDREEWVPRDGW